jgi:pimeloyl-ACP methyl ester carboxylesterase
LTDRETVVLVHGLWMHGAAMVLMQRRIAHCGYRVVRYSYPSMRLSLVENAARLAEFCRGLDATRIHLAGHSLGGLVIVSMLEREMLLRVGRVVLMGSPCGDSLAASRLARLPGGRALLGRSILEWRPVKEGRRLGSHEIGIIAGNIGFGLGRLVAPDLPRPNDGVVAVEETRLPGMREHVVLGVNHFGMVLSAAVARQACAFLRHGRFAAAGEKGREEAA